MKRRKGQWVLITSLILCTILANLILLKTAPMKIEDISGTKKPIFANIKSETTKAINTITKENTSSAHIETSLMTWTSALKDYAENHNTQITGYYIVAIPKDSTYAITISNFLGATIDTLNMTLEDSSLNLTAIEDGNTTTFTVPESGTNLTFAYILKYTDSNSETRLYNTTFTTTRKIFSIRDLTMSSETEVIRDCMTNY